MRSVPPRFTLGKRRTFLDDRMTFNRDSRSKGQVSLPRAQARTLPLIIVVCGPESVLPDVLAIHTIEMIPKSMILQRTCLSDFLRRTRLLSSGVPNKQEHCFKQMLSYAVRFTVELHSTLFILIS